jgi:hypothetical protein
MLIDCETCSARDVACDDCVVGVLLGLPATGATLDADERTAIGVLAASGLVPPLRLAAGPPQSVDLPAPAADPSPTVDDRDELPPAVSA